MADMGRCPSSAKARTDEPTRYSASASTDKGHVTRELWRLAIAVNMPVALLVDPLPRFADDIGPQSILTLNYRPGFIAVPAAHQNAW